MEHDYVWFWRARLPDRKGQPCCVLARGGRNSILVRFADGYLVVTSRHAVRKMRAAAPHTDRSDRSGAQRDIA